MNEGTGSAPRESDPESGPEHDAGPRRESRTGPTLDQSTDAVRQADGVLPRSILGREIPRVPLPPAPLYATIRPFPPPGLPGPSALLVREARRGRRPRVSAFLFVWQITVSFACGVLGSSLAGLASGPTDLSLAIVAATFAGSFTLLYAVSRRERPGR